MRPWGIKRFLFDLVFKDRCWSRLDRRLLTWLQGSGFAKSQRKLFVQLFDTHFEYCWLVAPRCGTSHFWSSVSDSNARLVGSIIIILIIIHGTMQKNLQKGTLSSPVVLLGPLWIWCVSPWKHRSTPGWCLHPWLIQSTSRTKSKPKERQTARLIRLPVCVQLQLLDWKIGNDAMMRKLGESWLKPLSSHGRTINHWRQGAESLCTRPFLQYWPFWRHAER